MTIKQHGGVFGRNPKFNSVEVESLSIAGNAVPDASTILVDGDIGSTVQGYDADTAKYDDATANFTGTLQNGGSNVLVDTDIGSTVQGYDADTAKLDVAQTFTAAQTFNENIVMANTKGIDFSATAGTGTSELFNDYEEGFWSPQIKDANDDSVVATFSNSGSYVKVGKIVYISIRLVQAGAITTVGAPYLTLPFTPATVSRNTAVMFPSYISALGSAVCLYFIDGAAVFNFSSSLTSPFSSKINSLTGSVNPRLYVSGIYQAES